MIKKFLIILFLSANALWSMTILAPDNPSSIPVIIAAEEMDDFDVKLFQSHTQAHSMFLSGKNPLILTGYAVGESFANRGVPVKLAASYVKGLNYLVTNIPNVTSFRQLKDEKIYFPFKGSPIEKMSLWLAEQEGIRNEDLEIGYLAFNSMIEMMRQGNIHTAVMPVSAALQIAGTSGFYYAVDLDEKWQQITGSSFYPQLGLFYNTQKMNMTDIQPFLKQLAVAIDKISQNPEYYAELCKDKLSIPHKVILMSLEKIKFELYSGYDLTEKMEVYFEKSGIKPPPDSFYKIDK